MSIVAAAVGIVFNETDSAVLLVQRKDIPVWVLPGGGIESNETPEKAVVREIEEETGYHVRIRRKCAEYTPVNKLARFTSVFVCDLAGGTSRLSEETSNVAFFPLDSLPSTLFFVHREWLDDALKNNPEIIRRELNSVNYFSLIKLFFKHPFYIIRYFITRFTKS